MDALIPDPRASAAVSPWAICDGALPLRLPDAMRIDLPDDYGEAQCDEALADLAERDDAPLAEGEVAVIRAAGVVLPRAHPVYETCGYAVSCESLAARIEQAAGTARAVAVLFDSPGGSAAGVPEAAARIAAAASGDTPVVAVADYLAASAAYWLAAACTAVVASPSAQVGSVGVRLIRPSFARLNDDAGIDVDAIYRGEGKLDYYIEVGLGDAGKERLQRNVDVVYGDFTRAVAAARGVPRATVVDEWGARLLTSGDAKRIGMVDEVRPAAEVVRRLGTAAGRNRYRRLGDTAAAGRILAAVANRV